MPQLLREHAVSAPDLYHEVQEFYARQMQTIDGGDAAGWAGTFTEDGVFTSNARPEPVRGRAVIAAATAGSVAERAARGVVHRHMMTMLHLDPRADGSLFARSYVLVVATYREGGSELLASTVCEDVLVRDAGRWRVSHRHVIRDDHPSPTR
ncbi:MAG TPA: nuclear transport factor 2 family protein [Mycobacteriales bacterium]|nr:nuclear transport factor 2 family protein [Mycobacteriales bacterium]